MMDWMRGLLREVLWRLHEWALAQWVSLEPPSRERVKNGLPNGTYSYHIFPSECGYDDGSPVAVHTMRYEDMAQ